MSLPGPFLAGQRLKAGALNDATQKTLKSVEISATGALYTTSGTTELNIPRLALSNIPQVNGGLYGFDVRLVVNQTVLVANYSFFIRRDTALTGTIIAEIPLFAPPSLNGELLSTWTDVAATLNENVNYFASLKQTAGTGTMTLFGQLNTAIRTGIKISRVGYSSEFAVIP
jgi:hypothetical protein